MSDDAQDDMVKLSVIPTLRKAYATGLTAAVKPKYPPLPPALDVISLWKGDITKLEADAIVNAANKSLLGGGGVDGAIHRAAGDALYDECEKLGGADTGEVKITKGYDLPAKYVLHAVGPVYNARKAEEKAQQLAACYRTSYELAVKSQLKSIGFCSISTGVYGYPVHDATHIALDCTRRFLEQPEGETIERIVFVVFSEKDRLVYDELIPEYFPPEKEKDEEKVVSESTA